MANCVLDFLHSIRAVIGFESRQFIYKSPAQGLSRTIWAEIVVLRPAEWRSCLIESAHLVSGRPLGRLQPRMFGMKSETDLSYRDGGRHAEEMSRLDAWCVHGYFGC